MFFYFRTALVFLLLLVLSINLQAQIAAANDCSNANTLTSALTCTPNIGNVHNAFYAGNSVFATCGAGYDVWYKFKALSPSHTITLTPTGSNFKSPGVQLLSGNCTSGFTSLKCGTASSGSYVINATGLEVDATYYIRIYSTASNLASNRSGEFSICITHSSINIKAGRLGEVFEQRTLSGANLLNDPWEITYGNDGYLWITEAKGYKVYRMDPNTGAKTTVLDISNKSTFLLPGDTSFNVQFPSSQSPWPQGGFAGLALHPQFLDPVSPKNFVYVGYVRKYNGKTTEGHFFVNRLVRFTFNTATGRLQDPVSLCDTLPGSNDHNSQRMIIAPVNGVPYLFYASGDMGSGQFDNASRPIKSQNADSYEGKILRFNLEPDGDAGTLDKWIPNDNPFNGAKQSAVWSTGIRNNQGFAFANINGTEILFGSSHGPYSDDEINIIEKGKNYGHPLVIGYTDGNYNNSKAGSPTGSLPLIVSEAANASAIGSAYRDPIFSAYAPPAGNPTTPGTVNYIYNNNPPNGGWPSEGWSGMDIYTNTVIPGWKNSLVVASLKWGRVLRLKLNASGTGIVPTNGADTISYFGGTNRFRDVAFSPNGKDLFVIMDKSSTTSGPTASNPVVPACGGCVQKYTFLGYQSDAGGKSTIPTAVGISSGTANTCHTATTVTIDNTNNNLWVPITGPDGNILAEIKANGNNLGTITSSFYINSGTVRQDASKRLYLNRNVTITPQYQPATPVSIRLYLTHAEFNALKNASNSAGTPSGVTAISDISIYKNNDACGAALATTPQEITPVFAEAFGADGYVLQANISSFSSFYFSNQPLTVLPLHLVYFKGALHHNAALLQWQTINENNTASFDIERSTDGQQFRKIGSVAAQGNSTTAVDYSYPDNSLSGFSAPVVYYRLKMVDADGRFTYSNTIHLPVPQRSRLVLFPNPVKNSLSVRLESPDDKPVSLQITDLQGRIIYTKNKISRNAGNIEIDVKHWKPQLYIIKIINSKNVVIDTQKFEKI